MKFKTLSAEKYCEFVTDGTHDSPKTRETGRFLITSKHLGRYEIDFSSAKLISERDYQKVIERSRVEKWDILFSMIGTIGNLYIETNDITDYACKNMGIFKLGGNEKKAKWLYYYLQTPKIKEYVLSISRGTTQGYVPLNALRSLPVEFPNDNTRDRVSNILWNIDEKIKTNTAINKNLESQAQAIFKSWFVDFEPFGGEMPRDWKYCNLEDLGQDIVCGKTPSTKRKEYYGGNIPFVTIPDMHNQIYITETERYLSIDGVKTQPTKTLPKNTICVSCIGTAGLVSLTSKDCQTNQQINSIIPKDHISPYYVYFLMKSLSETIIRLGGSGSTIVNLNKGQFAKIEVVIPNLEDMSKFTYIVKSNFEMILSNQIENIRLAALRDTLLPRLMSGEIDVGNVEV